MRPQSTYNNNTRPQAGKVKSMISQLLKMQLALALFIFASLGDARASGPAFAKDVVPLLQQHCVSCHVTGEELGGLGLAPPLAYEQLVNTLSQQSSMVRVKPGAPEDSYLLHKLTGTHLDQGGTGTRMPQGFPPLTDAQVDLISQWIAQGAPDN